jgi:hypothetical protein
MFVNTHAFIRAVDSSINKYRNAQYHSKPCSIRGHVLCLREVIACLLNRALDPQQQCRLPLIQLAKLVVLEQLPHVLVRSLDIFHTLFSKE